jgi:hypothetical protein
MNNFYGVNVNLMLEDADWMTYFYRLSSKKFIYTDHAKELFNNTCFFNESFYMIKMMDF